MYLQQLVGASDAKGDAADFAVAVLAYGGYWQVLGTSVSASDRSRCEEQARVQNLTANDWAVLCADPGMAAMIDAKSRGDDAYATATRISAANRAGLQAQRWNWSVIAAGLIALAGAALVRQRRV